VIQGDSARADQEHSRSVATVKLPVPPAAGIACAVLLTATPHRFTVGATTLIFDESPQPQAESRSSVASTGATGGTLRKLDRVHMVKVVQKG
jgi:hypothetical protein